MSQILHSTAEERANTAFFRVMESAPIGLLICAALGLAIVGVFQFLFYFEILPANWPFGLSAPISASLALFFEGLGFYFLVTTVRDFSAGARKEGYIGLTATFLLWAYALWEATHVASAFDRNTPESYWSVFGVIGTITCIVRVVELRITLTVTSAFQRKNELAEAEKAEIENRKTILELTGKVSRYEQEKAEIENRKRAESEQLAAERERLAQLEAEDAQRRLIESKEAAEQEAEQLRRQLEAYKRKTEKNGAAVEQESSTISREKIQTAATDFYQKNQTPPTKEQIGKLLGVTERTISNHMNGSWKPFLESLTH